MKKKVRISLNPLESGHAFREDVMEKVNEILEESLNPLESGHAFRVMQTLMDSRLPL